MILRDTLEAFGKKIKASIPVSWCSMERDVFALCLQYGHARVRVGLDQHDGYNLQGRKEGGEGHPTTWMDLPLTLNKVTEAEAETWVLDVLRTGRTCEVGQGVGIRALDTWPPFSTVDYDLKYLAPVVRGEGDHHEGWDLNPDYQRGAVWTKKQQSQFVGFLLEGGQTPLIFLQFYQKQDNAPLGTKYWELQSEVIDGQQRLRAILDWMDGKIPAELTNEREIWWKDLNECDINSLPTVKVAQLDIPRAERLRFYIRLNRGGTYHSDSEIQKVRDLLAKETQK